MLEGIQGPTQFAEMLEKLADWAGDPSEHAPSGEPSPELAAEFRRLIDGPDAAQAADPAVEAVAGADSGGTALRPGPAELMPSPAAQEEMIRADMPRADGPPPDARGPDAVPPDAGPAEGGFRVPDAFGRFRADAAHAPASADGIPAADAGMAPITPAELLRTQSVLGLLAIQGRIGVGVSQSATEGMENLLKQSG